MFDEKIRKMKDEEFEEVFSLLKSSFPPDEYRKYDEQKSLFLNPEYSVYVVFCNNENKLKAFMAVWELEDFLFVEHFCVNPDFRNKGLGAYILSEIKKMHSCRMCLEAEVPENEMAERRIAFYERNGFFLNKYPYVQPAYSDEKKPVPLYIMTTEGKITESQFEKIKKMLYSKVYKKTIKNI